MVISFIKRLFGKSDPFDDFAAQCTRLSSIAATVTQAVKSKKYSEAASRVSAMKRIIGLPISSNNQCLINLYQRKQALLQSPIQGKEKEEIAALEKETLHGIRGIAQHCGAVGGAAEHLKNNKAAQKTAAPSVLIKHAEAVEAYCYKIRARAHKTASLWHALKQKQVQKISQPQMKQAA